MRLYWITFRSVTPAQRGERLLASRGFHSTLQRTPRWMQENGCGYCLRIGTDRIREVRALLDQAGLTYRKIYSQSPEGGMEEMNI